MNAPAFPLHDTDGAQGHGIAVLPPCLERVFPLSGLDPTTRQLYVLSPDGVEHVVHRQSKASETEWVEPDSDLPGAIPHEVHAPDAGDPLEPGFETLVRQLAQTLDVIGSGNQYGEDGRRVGIDPVDDGRLDVQR